MSIEKIHISTANGVRRHAEHYCDGDKHISITDFGLIINASSVDGWKFSIGDSCTLVAGENSEITCGQDGAIKAGVGSIIKAPPNCVIINSGGSQRCLLFEDEVYIKLDNSFTGYAVVKDHNIVIDGKEYEVSARTYQSIKSLLPF